MSHDLSSALSPKDRFYLEHREAIETWHGLRRQVTTVCEDLLATTRSALDDAAMARGWVTSDHQIGKYRLVAAYPSTTPAASDRTPLASVSLEWVSGSVIFDDPDNAPYVGIRVAGDQAERQVVRAAIVELTGDLRRARGAQSGGQSWPYWERVVAVAGWWDAPDAYLGQVVERFSEHLDLLSGHVVEALARAT